MTTVSPVRALRALKSDRRGVSAVEFALIAPVMVLMFAGAAEASLLLSADRKVTQSASTITDLVAQTESLTGAELNDIFAAARTVLEPFPAAPACMRVTSVVMPTANAPQVGWSRSNGCTTQGGAPGTAVPDAGPLLAVGGSVIMGEISYSYSSPISMLFGGTITINERFFARPRRSTMVTMS
jgi:Flp pilus assembly protein TadG